MGPSTAPLHRQPRTHPPQRRGGPVAHHLSETDYALAKSAKTRAAGLDDIPTKAWQWLDTNDRTYLLNLLNDAWTSQSIPQEWQTALVVEIYKCKGALDDPNNYRPISLLSTAYKLLARILQQRLAAGLDQHLRGTQYGFRMTLHFTASSRHPQTSRKGRARRPLPLHAPGMPEGILNLLTNVYTSQPFQVKATGQTSEVLEAKAGIPQGCPLSPYLFLIVHSMILFDVDKQLLEDGGLPPWVFSQQAPLYDMAYADDTALIAG